MSLTHNPTNLNNNGIVLVEPTNTKLMSPSLILRGNTLEPYAIESIGAYSSHNGFDNIHIIQQYSLSDEELIQEILTHSPLVVGFSVLTCDYSRIVEIASKIKTCIPNVYIVLGGYHPTLNIEDTLQNKCIDFVVFGEGEITFCELINTIIHKDNGYSQIDGLAYKIDSKVIVNRPRARIKNPDDLPPILRNEKLLKRSRNWNLPYPSPLEQMGVAQISFSRGCLFNCNFCISPTLWNEATFLENNNTITYRSVDNVIDEIKNVKNRFKINFIYFNDLTINNSESRLQSLCKAITENGLHNPYLDVNRESDVKDNIHWFCLAKIGLTAETAGLMAKAGCSKIGFGVESFYKKGHTEMHKPFKGFTDIKETLEHTDSVGIINRVYIILGVQNETLESIQATIDGLLSTKVDQIRIAYFTPFPGSELYNEYKDKDLLIEDDLAKFDGDTPVVKCSYMSTQELVESRKKIVDSFYSSPIFIERCSDKIKRFPRLYNSYKYFVNELFELSNGEINIRKIL